MDKISFANKGRVGGSAGSQHRQWKDYYLGTLFPEWVFLSPDIIPRNSVLFFEFEPFFVSIHLHLLVQIEEIFQFGYIRTKKNLHWFPSLLYLNILTDRVWCPSSKKNWRFEVFQDCTQVLSQWPRRWDCHLQMRWRRLSLSKCLLPEFTEDRKLNKPGISNWDSRNLPGHVRQIQLWRRYKCILMRCYKRAIQIQQRQGYRWWWLCEGLLRSAMAGIGHCCESLNQVVNMYRFFIPSW